MAIVSECNNMTSPAYLIKMIDHVPGDMIPLTSKDVTIGRNSCNISIQDLNVSRYHCCLKGEGKNWSLIDLKSLNGTFIGNERLRPNTPYPLNDGRVISIGPPANASTTFLFKTTEDPEMHGIITEGSEKKQDECLDSDFSKSNAISSSLKRKSDPESSDNTLSDSQRIQVVPSSVNPSLDEDDDDVSDSSICSTDSLKTRIRKMCSANRKKSDSKNDNSKIPSASGSNFKSHENHQQNCKNESSGSGITTKRFKKQEQNSCLREEFAVLNALCNEPESSSMGDISGNENSESLLNENITPCEPHVSSEEQVQKTLAQEEEDAIRLEYERANERLEAAQKELEELQELERKKTNKEIENLLEHFACIICAEVIDEPMVLNCSHTMCQYCLFKWKMKQKRCPVCREKIAYEIKNLLIRNFIDKTIETLDDEYQANRKELVSKRRKEMESWPKKKKKKRSHSRYYRRRIAGVRIIDEAGEGPSHINENSVIELSDSSIESE